MENKSINSVVGVILIAVVLIGFGAYIVLPQQSRSDIESRNLQTFPELSFKTVFEKTENVITGKTENFMILFEEYCADQFVARSFWVSSFHLFEGMLQHKKLGDVFLGSEGRLLIDTRYVDLESRYAGTVHADQFRSNFVSNVKWIKEAVASIEVPAYLAMATNSTTIYPDMLPPNAAVFSEQDMVLQYMQEKVGEDISFINLYPALAAHKNEEIFYKTDHHWTLLGAYYAYESICASMGLTPVPLDQFDVETLLDSQGQPVSFSGTYYPKVFGIPVKPDTMTKFTPKFPANYSMVSYNMDAVGTKIDYAEHNSFYVDSHLETAQKYEYYTGNIHGYTEITSDVPAEPRTLLLIKDSYAHSMIPFLANHYTKIMMIDYRDVGAGLTSLVEEVNPDEVLFLYSVTGFSDVKLVNLTR